MVKSFHLWFLFMILFVSIHRPAVQRSGGRSVSITHEGHGENSSWKDLEYLCPIKWDGICLTCCWLDPRDSIAESSQSLKLPLILLSMIWTAQRHTLNVKWSLFVSLFLSVSLTDGFCLSWRGSQLRKVHHPLVQKQQIKTQTLLLPPYSDIRERLQHKSQQLNKADQGTTRAHPEHTKYRQIQNICLS